MSVFTLNIPGLDPVEGRIQSFDDVPKKQRRPFNLVEAPVLYPDDVEFKDPYAYINSLSELGEKYGILKIVAPPKWSPKFSIDVGQFRFDCRKQTINKMGAVTRSTMDWVKRMANFHYLFDNVVHDANIRPMVKYPRVGNGVLNYYKLNQIVNRLGGYKVVDGDDLWGLVTAKLELSTILDTKTANTIRDLYHKYVLPYEQYISYVEFARQNYGKKKTTSRNGNGKVVVNATLSAAYLNEWSRRHLHRQNTAPIVYSSPPSERKNSYFITATTTTTPSRTLPPSPPPDTSPTPKRPRRNFKEEEADDLPISKRTQLRRSSYEVDESSARNIKSARTRSREYENNDEDEEKDEVKLCPECSHPIERTPLPQYTLTCKDCEQTYHTNCLTPIICVDQTSSKWCCPNCLVGTGEFYFDEGEQYDLPKFQEMANNFKAEYLETELPIVDPDDVPLVECLAEQNFWHYINDPNCPISVEYGSDIRCDVKGSGFPMVTKDPCNRYAKHPWNLNNFPVNKMSLFRYLKTDISGVTVPWAYVGMMFSAFCWHTEDHATYSINYQHFGETKTWYGIPGAFADKFEKTSKELVPDLFEKQPDILFQRCTMIPPDVLVKNGVPCHVVDQHPGEFVITFPNAYHAGFNHGFNYNEAVNYAPPDWVDHGKMAVNSYKLQYRPPIFSHEELLLRTAVNDRRIETSKWLYPHLVELLNEEVENRSKIDNNRFYIKETKNRLNGCDEDSYECCICSCLCYISRLVPTENKSKVYCYDHFQMDKTTSFELEQSFTIDELEEICQGVKEIQD